MRDGVCNEGPSGADGARRPVVDGLPRHRGRLLPHLAVTLRLIQRWSENGLRIAIALVCPFGQRTGAGFLPAAFTHAHESPGWDHSPVAHGVVLAHRLMMAFGYDKSAPLLRI